MIIIDATLSDLCALSALAVNPSGYLPDFYLGVVVALLTEGFRVPVTAAVAPDVKDAAFYAECLAAAIAEYYRIFYSAHMTCYVFYYFH